MAIIKVKLQQYQTEKVLGLLMEEKNYTQNDFSTLHIITITTTMTTNIGDCSGRVGGGT